MIALTSSVTIYYNMISVWSIFYFIEGFRHKIPVPEDFAHSYFATHLLGLDPYEISWSNFGTLQWHLVVLCLATWIIVAIALARQLQDSMKLVYFASLFPFVFLFLSFIASLTLEGASEGLAFFLKSDKILSIEVTR